MFLIFLLFLTSISLEAIGSLISIIGLAAAFSADPIIITMAATLDFSKIIAVSVLSKKWKSLNAMAKLYLTIASLILMIITSAGIAGYLSNAFQKAILPNQDTAIQLRSLQQEQMTLQARKQEIDQQIAKLPANQVYGRQRLMKSFAPEEDKINKRLDEITIEIPKLQSTDVKQNTEVGPVMFLSEILKIPPSQAVMIVIGLVVFVFDPLSIMFLVTGNNLLNVREREKQQSPKIDNADLNNLLKEATQAASQEKIEPKVFQNIEKEPEIKVVEEPLTELHRLNHGCQKTPELQEESKPTFISRAFDPLFNMQIPASQPIASDQVIHPVREEKIEPSFTEEIKVSSPHEIKVEPKSNSPAPPSSFIDEEASSVKDQLYQTLEELLKDPSGTLSEEDRNKLDKALEPILDRNKIRKSALLDSDLDLIAGAGIHNAPHEGPDSSILKIYQDNATNQALVEEVRS